MSNYRVKVNYDKDQLAFVNKEYIVYKKDSVDSGTLFTPFDLIAIGISGLEDVKSMFANETDFSEIVNGFIRELESKK